MEIYDENLMAIVEGKFKKFMQLSVIGVEKDHYNKKVKTQMMEILVDEWDNWVELNDSVCLDETLLNDVWQTENLLLCRAIKSLTPRQLEVIILTVLKNFTEIEVASRYGITQQGVHSTKSKALKKLKKLLKESAEK